ncbi:uncharacterized protein LOC126833826 isoform X2 [Adelges cooleyi]|uniref:uncharacterized protein LOC126833826 isoform X2 n=1 Tax=Adelges cooleyi TaxID=133065 RepID=UPI00217F803C|nr:uncharacterized protein LOC126833826 isoform X2 [Adelges cooleyi]
MQIYCVLISYTFVNILAVNIVDSIKTSIFRNKHIEQAVADKFQTVITSIVYGNPSMADYIREVDITNKHIKLAGDGLKTVITNILCGNASMEKIAFMLFVPEYANTGNLWQCIKHQTDMQREIINAISLPVPNVQNQTVPEPDIENQIPPYTQEQVMSYSDFNELSELGTERRSETGKAVRSLFDYATKNEGMFANEKLEELLNDFDNYDDSRDSEFSYYLRMCRLKGMVKSIENPRSYIINAKFCKEDYSCRLTAVDRSVKSYTSYGVDT